jgi:Prokaryotic phospholipase A2
VAAVTRRDITGPGDDDQVAPNPLFDQLAREVANSVSRRRMLSIMGTVWLGAITDTARPRRRAAIGMMGRAVPSARSGGSASSGGVTATTASAGEFVCPAPSNAPPSACGGVSVGLDSIDDFGTCTHVVTTSGYTPGCDGCGSGALEWAVPDKPLGFDFTAACLTHDVCYGTCLSNKDRCDQQFGKDMLSVCPRPTTFTETLRASACARLAGLYQAAVSNLGRSAWEAGQLEACRCCVDVPPCGGCSYVGSFATLELVWGSPEAFCSNWCDVQPGSCSGTIATPVTWFDAVDVKFTCCPPGTTGCPIGNADDDAPPECCPRGTTCTPQGCQPPVA